MLFRSVDSSIPLDENDEEILEILRDKKAIILLNKSDLTPVVTKEMLEARTDMPVLADTVLAVCDGKQTKAEALGISEGRLLACEQAR